MLREYRKGHNKLDVAAFRYAHRIQIAVKRLGLAINFGDLKMHLMDMEDMRVV
jgi:hypothetical protein